MQVRDQGALGRRQLSLRKRVPKVKRYGPRFRSALKVCWEASNYPCSQRLQPFLPDLAAILERHGQVTCSPEIRELLGSASVATVERNLRELRHILVGWRMSQTKPGGLLRREVPVVVGRWRERNTPGYLEIDLVAHNSGEVAAGERIWTLCTTDLSTTSWSERVPVMGKGQTRNVAALERIQRQLPFLLLGLHPDNGSEFLNWHLLHWCRQAGTLLSHSRPEHENDNCHVAQKNWAMVQRLIGYQRLDTQEQLGCLDSLYGELLRPYDNGFQPVMKLIDKEAVGDQVRKLYDRPATPLQQVLDSGQADPAKIQQLVALYTTVRLLTLKRQVDRRLAAMPAALRVFHSA